MENSRRKTAHAQMKTSEESLEKNEEEEEEGCHCQPRSDLQSTILQDLPSHLTMDILSRLPMKTLLACRCVCKMWQTVLLSDPHFIDLHLSRAPISILTRTIPKKRYPRMLHLFDLQDTITHLRNSRIKLKKKINLPNEKFGLVTSCNGLLCLCEFNTNDPIYVYNPILGEYITLPKAKKGVHLHQMVGAGFGFSIEAKQYKVIRVLCTIITDPITGRATGNYSYEVEIYVLGTGTWRSIGEVPYDIGSCGTPFNTYVNGAVHWYLIGRDSPDFIRSFNFGTEQFRSVPEPALFCPMEKDYMNFMCLVCLGVLKGCLSICDFSESDHVDIWVMKEYGVKESWTRLFIIKNLICERIQDFYTPVIILDSGKVLMLFNNHSLVSYDPKEEVFKFLPVHGYGSEFVAIAHISSFVSLRDVAKGENLKELNTEPNLTCFFYSLYLFLMPLICFFLGICYIYIGHWVISHAKKFIVAC